MKQRQLLKALRELLGPQWFLKTTEEFDGSEGGIWTTNECVSKALDDGPIMLDSVTTHPKVAALLKQYGFYAEPYDAGTVMFYPQ